MACCSECPVCGKRIPQSAWRKRETAEDIAHWDPILISLVRRSMPNLIAADICGVQPICAPSGLIFAMRAEAIANGTYVPLSVDKKKFNREAADCVYRPRIERNIKIMHETTVGPNDHSRDGMPSGMRRELDIRKQVNCIEIVRDNG